MDDDPSDLETYDGGDLVIRTASAWEHYVEAWLASYDSPNTIKAYRRDELHWRAFCETKRVDPIVARRVLIDLWKTELIASGGYQGRPAATKTVNRKVSAIASLYVYLVHEGVLETSPAAHIKRPKVSDSYQSTAALDEDQAGRVLDAAESLGYMEYVCVWLLMFSGIRANELITADASGIVIGHGHVTMKITRKGKKDQAIPLSPETAAFLLEHLDGRRTGPIVHDAAGEPLDYWTLYYICTKAGRRARVGIVTPPHVFRATFATTYLNTEGAQIDRLQDVMGHADARTTKLYDRGAGALERMSGVMAIVQGRIMAARKKPAA